MKCAYFTDEEAMTPGSDIARRPCNLIAKDLGPEAGLSLGPESLLTTITHASPARAIPSLLAESGGGSDSEYREFPKCQHFSLNKFI